MAPRGAGLGSPGFMRIGNYEVVRSLATGGMGEVLLARQSGPGGFARAVVVKRLLPHLAKEPAFVQMFLNEARVVSRLSHPNVAQIYELGESGDTLFIAMEFVHGRSLQLINKTLAVRGRALGPPLAMRIIIETLKGLEHAHSLSIDGKPAPVVHRDMSPDNILVGFNGAVRVIDFGIARAADSVSTTRTGTLKGKFSYMAPERFDEASAKDLDARIDVFAMGVVAYECLAGHRPFRGSSDAALVGAILNGTAPVLHEVASSVGPELSAIVHRAIAKDPAERFATAADFRRALEGWLEISGAKVGEQDIAGLMRSLFADEADLNPATTIGSLQPIAIELRSDGAAKPRRWPLLAGVFALVLLGVGAWVLSTRAPEVKPVAVVPPPDKALPPNVPPLADKPPTGKPGNVSFRVKPWGEIWLGNEKLGTTPNVKVSRPPGQYTFTVKHPDYAPRELTVQVLPESELTVKVDLSSP